MPLVGDILPPINSDSRSLKTKNPKEKTGKEEEEIST